MSAITVYWRPGCSFCSGLLRSLDRIGLDVEAINIWEVEGAADVVRGIANGNETVPTVLIGDVGLVNPSTHQVMAALAEHAPDEIPVGYEAPEPGRLAGFVNRVLGG